MEELKRFQEQEDAQRAKMAEKRAANEKAQMQKQPIAAPPRVNVNVPKQPVM